MGLANLPSKKWTVNASWMLAVAIAHDLDAWTRLLGLAGDGELERAEPASMRFKIYAIPAKLTRHARTTTINISLT